MNKPLVDLQVYQAQTKPPPKKPIVNPAMYMPIPVQTPYFPPQMNPVWPYYTPSLVSPVIKQYSVNNGPFVNYSTLSLIKEDALPKQFVNTSNTLGERLNIHSFVRSVFIKYNDGEDIDLDGKGTNSLLSYLKFMELNPYNVSQHPMNPYTGLPDDMLIYRSCYPIKFDDRTNSVQCAPNAIGMNIRIYKLTNAEYNIKKLNQTNFNEYDVWREMAYYEYLREEVIKKKMCPNFVLMYAYYIAERCNVDFNKIKQLKGTYGKSNTRPQFPLSGMTGANGPMGATGLNGPMGANLSVIQNVVSQTVHPLLRFKTQSFVDTLEQYSGKGIVALTEAPTYNIYTWASKSYKTFGNIQKMMNTGYHTKEVWMSILFQIMVALYVLQLSGIAFNNFTLEDNVYVKDISQHENIVTYWKYKIKNFEFYVPNYGYLVLIDSNFKDLVGSGFTILQKKTPLEFKIYSNIFKDNVYDANSLNDKCFSNFTSTVNSNSFTNAFTNYGGTKPPSEIIDLLNKIYNDATSGSSNKDISHYIISHMGKLLNNRVGTYLTETEVKNIRKDDNKEFESGQMIVQQTQNQQYKFVIFVSQGQNNLVEVLTKVDQNAEDISRSNIERTVLFNYSRYDSILQNYKPMEANLNDEDLLETYVVAK